VAVPEIRIQGDVPAPPQVVWDLYTDHCGWQDWAGIREVVLRQQGDPPPNGVGASRVMRARGIAVEEEVIGFEPPRRLVYRLVGGVPIRNHRGEVLFSPSETGTHVEWIVRFDPLIPFTGALIARVLRRAIADVLRRLTEYQFDRAA
jgi:uncharacterized protein YndB with AHSA1/START domain